MMPSLSVVHTDPSRRRNKAPAPSSPATPNDPVTVEEAEGRSERIAARGCGQAVAADDRLPMVAGGAAQRIDAYSDAGGAARPHVDDVSEVGDIGPDVIVAVNASRFTCAVIGDAFDAPQTILEKAVGGALDHRSDIGIRRAAIGRIIFEAAIIRRIMRRPDHDAVGNAALPALVMGQDGAGINRSWRIIVDLVVN